MENCKLLSVKSALRGKKHAEKDNIIWTIRALRYGLPIRRSALDPVCSVLSARNKNDRCNAAGERARTDSTYCGKVRGKKKPSAILWRVRRGGRYNFRPDVESSSTCAPYTSIPLSRPDMCPTVSFARQFVCVKPRIRLTNGRTNLNVPSGNQTETNREQSFLPETTRSFS